MSPFRQRKSDTTALEPTQRRRDAAPAAAGPEPIRRLVDRTFVDHDEDTRARIARSVTSRLTERIQGWFERLVAQGPATGKSELHQMIEAEPPGADPFHAVAATLDGAACLALFSSEEPDLVTGALGADQGAALNEAALEAMQTGSAMARLDRACAAHCSARIMVLLERLAPSDPDRLEWRNGLPLAESTALPTPKHGEADERALMAALQRGDNARAVALLAAAALVPATSVQTAISLRSRRGLVSLAWKAGFSMRAAILLQSQLAGIAPDTVLVAHADGSCPLTRGEMVWQIGFLARKLV